MSKFDGKFGRISFESLPEEAQCEIVERWIEEGKINLFYKLCRNDETHYAILDTKTVIKQCYCPGPMFLYLDATAEGLENQLKIVRVENCDEEQFDAKEEMQRIANLLDCTPDEVSCTRMHFGGIPVPYTAFYNGYNVDASNPSLFLEEESGTDPILWGNLLIASGTDPITGKLYGLKPFDIDEFFAQDCIALLGRETDDNPNRFVFVTKGKKRSEK